MVFFNKYYYFLLLFSVGGMFTGGMAYVVQGRAFGFNNVSVLAVVPEFFVGAIVAITILFLVLRSQSKLKEANSRLEAEVNIQTAKIRRSEEKFRGIFNHSSSAMVTVGKTGNFVVWNEAFREMLGYDNEELKELSFRDMTHPDDLEASKNYVDKILSGELSTFRIEKRWIRKDKSICWGEISVAALRNNDGEIIGTIANITNISKHKAFEEKLQGVATGLANAQRRANLGSWSWDVVSGAVEWSDETFRIYGYEPGAIAPTYEKSIEFVRPSDRDAVQLALSEAMQTGKPYSIEHWIVRADGEERYITDLGEVTFDDQGEIIRMDGTVLDITERKIAQDSLTIQEERLKRGQFFANIGTWDWNIETGDLVWTDRIPMLFGYPDGNLETSYENFLAALHPDDREDVMEAVNRCVEKDEPYEIEHRVVWPDGTVRWLHECGAVLRNEEGKAVQMLGVVRDINTRKLAESALVESEEKLSKLFELSPLGIALTDMGGKYLEFNKAFSEMCGYAADELAQLDYWTLTPAEYREQEAEQLKSLLATERYGPYEKVLRQKNGEIVPIRLNGMLVKDSTGQSRIWSIVENITEDKKAQKQLEEAKLSAERANQAKSAFLSSMSHELRTPLNAILGFAQLFEFEKGLSKDQENSAKEIYRAGEHLLSLINEVLDLARIEAGHVELSMEPVDLSQIVDECMALMAPFAETHEIELGFTASQFDNLFIESDYTRLKQVILNLMSNGVKYNHAKGSVRINCTKDVPGRIRLAVIDTGMGISERNLKKLFQPFNRLGVEENTDIEGTGIGLVITKQLVDLMGGTMGVNSVIGQGSTFWLEFPLLHSTKIDKSSDSDSDNAVNVKPLETLLCDANILVAEDNVVNQFILKKQLKLLGCKNVTFAENGVKALAYWRQSSFDILLTDIHMPLMDGYELVEQIRESESTSSGLPIVAITASAMDTDTKRCLENGMDDFISKPFSIRTLQGILEKWIPM